MIYSGSGSGSGSEFIFFYAMVELQSHHQNKGPTLDGEYRLVANERAEFIGLQRASNGETRIATSLEDGIAMATKHPQSGILVSINGAPPPFNVNRMTGGKLVVSSTDAQHLQKESERELPLPQDMTTKEAKRQDELIKTVAREKEHPDIKLPDDKQHAVNRDDKRLHNDINQLNKDAELSERQLRKLAEIGEVAKAKFTHELHDKLDKLEREIIKELTKGE